MRKPWNGAAGFERAIGEANRTIRRTDGLLVDFSHGCEIDAELLALFVEVAAFEAH